MGFSKFTMLMGLVIGLGVLAVMALPGGRPAPIPQVSPQHPWKSFATGSGNFEVPLGWLAYDPFSRVALDTGTGGCLHVPPRFCQAAYFRSPDQRVELFLAYGPADRLSSLLPVPEHEATDTIISLAASVTQVDGALIRWTGWDPSRSRGHQTTRCLVGSARSGDDLFLVHISGRPASNDLESIASLLRSIRLPGS